MAADYITVNRNKMLGNSLVRAADLLRELRELTDKLSDIANHSFTGSDFTLLETNFGLNAGQGAAARTLLTQVDGILNTTAAATGAERLAAIDDFCSRLSGQ